MATPPKRGKLNIRTIMTHPTRMYEYAGDALAAMFRKMSTELNINYNRFISLMEKYLDDPANGFPRETKKRSHARTNLQDAFFADTMTWKTFLRTFRLAKIDPDIVFSVTFTRDGKKHTVSVPWNLDGKPLKELLEEMSKGTEDDPRNRP